MEWTRLIKKDTYQSKKESYMSQKNMFEHIEVKVLVIDDIKFIRLLQGVGRYQDKIDTRRLLLVSKIFLFID